MTCIYTIARLTSQRILSLSNEKIGFEVLAISSALLLVPLVLMTTHAPSAQAAIFGVDNRQLMTPTSPKSVQARATAIAVLNSFDTVRSETDLSKSSSFSSSATSLLGSVSSFDLAAYPLTSLCKDEKFYSAPSLSYSCTGFLVAPDLLVTAGHCVFAVNSPNQVLKDETELACKAFDWLFDYQADAKGETQLQNLPLERLYHCKRIIYAVQHEQAPYDDYALIQLDRPALDRTPLKLSTAPLKIDASLFMIGHPYGVPNVLTDQGRVILNNPARTSFITTLDAFEGNSGSPVLAIDNTVVGILVGGTPGDNTFRDVITPLTHTASNSVVSEGESVTKTCERFNRCSEDGLNCKSPDHDTSIYPGFQKTGSEVQRIQPIIDLLKNHTPADSNLSSISSPLSL